MRGRLKYLFLIPGVASLISAQAQESTTAWSLEKCIGYASSHNIQVASLRLDQQSSMQDLLAARAAKIPTLSATLSNSFTNANNIVDNQGKLANQLTSNGTYLANSSVVLWNDGLITNSIRQKELETESAGLSIQQSLNNITLLITAGYLDILLARENLKYVQDLVNTSEARVKQGQQFYDAGRIARKDLLQLQAQLASDKYLLVQTQNTIRLGILALKQTLQLPSDSAFDVLVPPVITPAILLAPLSDAQQTALNEFPDTKISKLGIDIASLDIAKAKAGFKPILSASGALGTGYSEVLTNSVNAKTGYFTQAGNNFYQRVGLTLSIPIFSNRVNRSNLEKANISYRIAKLNLQNSQLVLSQAVEQAYLNASNAMQSYAAAQEQLNATSESYRITNEQFKLGSINSYDLLQQRNQYVQAVQAFTQAKYAAVLQQKIYDFYMGKAVTL
jgi:outer membrane protein